MKQLKSLVSFLLSLTLCLSVAQTPMSATESRPWDDEDSSLEETVETESSEVEEPPVEEEKEEEEVNEEIEEVSMPAQYFSKKADGVTVKVNAPEGALPEGTIMTVTKASSTAVQAAAEALNADAEDVKAVDISFSVDGQEIEPAMAINVSLSAENVSDDVQVVHIDDANNAEIVKDVTVEGATVQFEAESFSVYAYAEATLTTVNFNYNGSTISTQVVKVDKGEKLYDPSGEADLEDGILFKGWKIGSSSMVYTIDELNTYLESHKGQTITVNAQTYRAYSVTYKAEDIRLKVDTVEPASGETTVTYTVDQAYEVAAQNEQFLGWMVEGEDTVYQNGDEVTLTKNLVLVAKVGEGYWLTFNENGKGATYNSPVFAVEGQVPTMPSNPTRPGYTFSGWYTAAIGGTQYTASKLTENTTVYAHWTMNEKASYTVNYWKQKVTDAVDATTKTYVFAEYTTVNNAETGSEVTRTNENKYAGFDFGYATTETVEPDGSTVVNVYYNRKVVTINFKIKKSYYSSWTNYRTYSGLYEADFNGWNNDYGWYRKSDLSDGGAIILTSYDVTTAGYVNNTGNVKASDGTVITCNFYGTTLDRSNNIYYYNETWDGNFVLADYVVCMGSGISAIHEKYEGYELYKYSSTNSSQSGDKSVASWWVNKYNCVDGQKTSNKYNYIASKLKSYKLNYMSNGVKIKEETIKYTTPLTNYGSYVPATIPVGEMFVGWYADSACTVKFDFENEKMPRENTQVYAKFESIQYRVVLETNGGTLPSGQADNFKVDYGKVVQDSALQEPLFTKEGYTLVGWYTDAAMTKAYNFNTQLNEKTITDKTYREETAPQVQGKLTLYAKWRKNPDATSTISVIYDAAEGTNAPTDETPYKLGAEVTVQKASIAPSGKVFDRWAIVNASGSVVSKVTPGASFTIDDSDVQEDEKGNYFVKLVAIYVEKTSTSLKYDANGGGTFNEGVQTEFTNLPLNKRVTTYTVDVLTPKTGYVLLGWDQDKDATKPTFTVGQDVGVDNLAPSENVLYAIWEKAFYVFHSSDLSVDVVKMTDSYNVVETVKSGYLYGGYYKNYSGKGSYADDGISAKDGTIYTGGVGSWTDSDAYTTSGKAFAPEAGKTYYLKEVPESYLLATHIEVSEKNTKQLYDAYLTTSVDDLNYNGLGFVVDGTKVAFDGLSTKITITHGANSDVNTPPNQNVFTIDQLSNNTKGYLASRTLAKIVNTGKDATYNVLDKQALDVSSGRNIKCYWVTPDNITVVGAGYRKLTITDRNSDGFFTVKLTGDQKEIIFNDQKVDAVIE